MGGWFSVVRPDLRFTALSVTAVLYAVGRAKTTFYREFVDFLHASREL
jgi:hypothetical protein